MTSGGGLTPVESALRFPVRLVESGPAGGAIFASRIAATLDERKVIAFDMGGTTAKICLIRDFQPETARTFEVDRAARFMKGSGLPVRIPVIELVEIGAGGGSVAGVDELRRIRVGPESASSDPGPACYGLGGQAPTVTDADLTLGLIEPELFAGGTIRLLPGLSRLALEGGVGEALGLDADMAAHGIYEMVCENMASAARTHAVERGASTDQFTIIASGGAAPLHVARVAEKIGAGRVIVPPNAGVGSAVGFLAAPISYEIVRTGYLRLDAFDPHAANALLGGATEEIGSWLRKATDAPLVERRLAFMRYLGQGHEIPVDLPEGALDDDSAAILRASFETTYRDLFRRTVPGAEIEVMAWSVRISTESRLPAAVPGIARKKPATPFSVRQVYDGQMRRSTPVPFFRRTDLEPGDVLRGPAVVCERETSTFVSGAFDAVIDATGSIVMDRKPKEIAA
jgi:N-methylhydantoinase A